MEPSALLGFGGLALTLIAVPGPDWGFILATGARDRVVGAPVAGLVTGYTIITIVVALGVGPFLAAVPLALAALTIAGASYLIYLGVTVLRTTAASESEAVGAEGSTTVQQARTATGTLVRRGMGVTALNPKGLLLFLTILPQFVRPEDDWPVSVQLVALGLVFIVICAAFYSALGYTAGWIFRTYPGAARLTTRVAGAAMVVVGLLLLAEQVSRALDVVF